MYDVVVVGGGPVGSRVAFRMAENGYSVLVLEKKSRPGGKTACTGIVGRECVHAFQIEDRVVLRELNSASLYSPSGRLLHLYRKETQACILDRSAFDVSLAERAQKAGAAFSFHSRVMDVNVGNSKVDVAVDQRGNQETISAGAVVIAAGFNPGLLEKLGAGTCKDFTIGVQAEVEAPGVEEVGVYFGDVAPGFFAWLVPTVPPLARAGLLARENPGYLLKKWLAELAAQGRIKSADVRISYGGIPLRPLARTCGERLLVVGDAAGQVKPTSGGGIYYGLLCADIAAATLDGALKDDDLSARRLARYERAWRKKLGRELRTGYWFRKIFERLSNRQIDRLFRVVSAGGIDEALLKAGDVSFDWHGRTIMKLLKYKMVARTIGQIRLPFKTD
jgi:digeranylgeranylglycerophospholipid reductase